ncbi:hypothetical protein K491DRAFT_691080 [Lophiostoma macrostomum CBS 122681]|uniref:Uncharacterized protein n=1 Tax=Lophiostoma macrostomum CBS 122681 TaxID=1314788 RepID=A0A6A6TDP2_9PLEO|nr:hypothetical protein K491DRAFT_691080 [Lophiostoma macrostomum CBS 122681]
MMCRFLGLNVWKFPDGLPKGTRVLPDSTLESDKIRFARKVVMVSATLEQHTYMSELLRPLIGKRVTCDIATEQEREMLDAGVSKTWNVVCQDYVGHCHPTPGNPQGSPHLGAEIPEDEE